MNWIAMKMRFPGKCVECGESVNVGEAGLWMKGTGVKHERCGAAAGSGDVRSGGEGGGGGELRCLVCGKPAGCPTCEFSDSCDTAAVSQLCMCYECMSDKDTYALYRAAASRKFPQLEPRAAEAQEADGRRPAGVGGGAGGDAGQKQAAAAAAAGRAGPARGQLREVEIDGGGRVSAEAARREPAAGRSGSARGQLREVEIDGGGGRVSAGGGKKRRGSASGQQRL